jgi:hypothetical protein
MMFFILLETESFRIFGGLRFAVLIELIFIAFEEIHRFLVQRLIGIWGSKHVNY